MHVISTPEQEFNIVKSSLFYCRETQYDCFSFVIIYWKQSNLSMSASKSRNLKIVWFSPCIFLFYLPVDSATHVDLSLILNSMLDSIKTKKYFFEQENGRQWVLVPVLGPSWPVWVCSNRWPSRFHLTFTRLAHIHDGCCQREYSFTWVSLNQYIIGLFQLFIGRLLNSSYPIFE